MTADSTPDHVEPAGAVTTARPTRLTYVVGFADSFGLGIYLAFSAVYFNQVLHLNDARIGVLLAVSGITSVVGAVPIGRLADRLGPRTTLRGLFAIRAVSFLGLAVASSYAFALVAAAVAGLLSRAIGPIIQSTVIGDGTNDTAVRALARLRSLRNGGIALGALPASGAISTGQPLAYRLVLVLSAALFLTCALLATWFTVAPRARGRAGARVSTLRNRPFLGVTALYGLLTLSAIVLGVGFPLWIVQRTSAPAWSIGLIQILNTVIVVLAQVYVSRGSERIGRARLLMSWGGLIAAVAVLVIPVAALATNRWIALVLVITVVLAFTLAEMCTTAGSMGAALAHMPAERKATYLATFNLGFGAATVVGPPLVTLAIGIGWIGWIGWAVVFALGGVAAFTVPNPR